MDLNNAWTGIWIKPNAPLELSSRSDNALMEFVYQLPAGHDDEQLRLYRC